MQAVSQGHKTFHGVLCCIIGALVAGCNQSGDLTPVVGSVTLDGKPLTTGSVSFHPDTSKNNNAPQIAVGMLDDKGTYKLVSANKEGAAPGWYKVTITAQEPADPKNPYAPPKHLINPKFSDPQTSGIAVQVAKNPAPGVYDFKVTK